MSRDMLVKILDLARWAPSGDNTQPWRFEIVTDEHIAIHGFDTREHVLYDFDGHPSQMAHGALVETIRIAASGHQQEANWSVRPGCPENAPVYDVHLKGVPDLIPDPLLPYIEKRVVQRRPMEMTPLDAQQRNALSMALGANYSIRFFEKTSDRFKVARLLWDSAYIRLTCPEAYGVHKEIIEWGARFSRDRLPEKAIGVDPITAKLMQWVLQSWERVDFFNRYLLGTIAPRIQLDFIPAVACASHLLIQPKSQPNGLTDYVEAGIAMQRLWLTATALGLHLQPEMTPVIFHWYVRDGRKISTKADINIRATLLAARFDALAEVDSDQAFAFFCRVGRSHSPSSRSLRKSLEQLVLGQ